MNKNERVRRILDELNKENVIEVKQMSENFQVSMETIRRDLEALEKQHFLKRVHGGAIALKRNIHATNFTERKMIHIQEKQMIAKACVSLVQENDFLAFDVSTTNTMIVQELINHYKKLTILTNSLLIAQQVAYDTDWTILLPGGQVNNNELFVGGSASIEYINQFQIDKFFMSISGFTPEIGFMDYGFQEFEVKKAMYDNANQIYAVADHHKFGQYAPLKICEASEVTGLVTDEGIDQKIVKFFEDNKHLIYY